jgi:threonine/homoserine/homoserine lactone efflux protein
VREVLFVSNIFSPTNPKAVVLFIAVFATAVTSATPAWLMTLMIGLIFASALIW